MAKEKKKKKKLSATTKEIIKTAVVLIVIGIIVVVYAIYPLMKTKTVMGRENMDAFNDPDSIPVNDPTSCVEAGLACDTFRVEADALTSLAGLYIESPIDTAMPALGTVMLLHSDTADRSAMLPWAGAFVERGYNVVLYDHRASGYSTGKYHGEGRLEANDLEEVIGWMDIRDMLNHPVVVVGRGIGGDAAYLASLEEPRIEGVVAVGPYLSTGRMWEIKQERYDLWSFPFFKTMMWWWYDIRSGYAAPYREADDLEATPIPTLVYVSEEAMDSDEVEALRELSEGELLTIRQIRPEDELIDEVVTFISELGPEPIPEAGTE